MDTRAPGAQEVMPGGWGRAQRAPSSSALKPPTQPQIATQWKKWNEGVLEYWERVDRSLYYFRSGRPLARDGSLADGRPFKGGSFFSTFFASLPVPSNNCTPPNPIAAVSANNSPFISGRITTIAAIIASVAIPVPDDRKTQMITIASIKPMTTPTVAAIRSVLRQRAGQSMDGPTFGLPTNRNKGIRQANRSPSAPPMVTPIAKGNSG